MKTIYKYYKSSNSGDIILEQEFTETSIKQPKYYYRQDKKGVMRSTDTPDLKGYVEISEKKAKRALRKRVVNLHKSKE